MDSAMDTLCAWKSLANRALLARQQEASGLFGLVVLDQQLDYCLQELMDADEAQFVQKRRVPAGTSDYQAAWILDDDAGDGEDAVEADRQPSTPGHSAFPGPTSLGGSLTLADLHSCHYAAKQGSNCRPICKKGHVNGQLLLEHWNRHLHRRSCTLSKACILKQHKVCNFGVGLDACLCWKRTSCLSMFAFFYRNIRPL